MRCYQIDSQRDQRLLDAVIPTSEVETNNHRWVPVTLVDLSSLCVGEPLSCEIGKWTYEYSLKSHDSGYQLNKETGKWRTIRRIRSGDAASGSIPLGTSETLLPQKCALAPT